MVATDPSSEVLTEDAATLAVEMTFVEEGYPFTVSLICTVKGTVLSFVLKKRSTFDKNNHNQKSRLFPLIF